MTLNLDFTELHFIELHFIELHFIELNVIELHLIELNFNWFSQSADENDADAISVQMELYWLVESLQMAVRLWTAPLSKVSQQSQT